MGHAHAKKILVVKNVLSVQMDYMDYQIVLQVETYHLEKAEFGNV